LSASAALLPSEVNKLTPNSPHVNDQGKESSRKLQIGCESDETTPAAATPRHCLYASVIICRNCSHSLRRSKPQKCFQITKICQILGVNARSDDECTDNLRARDAGFAQDPGMAGAWQAARPRQGRRPKRAQNQLSLTALSTNPFTSH
jgi:hypothetical protein